MFALITAISAVFGLIFLPALNHLMRGIVSSYPKADLKQRAGAAAIDVGLVLICLAAYRTQDSVLYVVLGAMYALFRDALFVPGQSVGKFVAALVVVDIDTGRPAGRWQSVKRNFIFVVPGLNVVAFGFEAVTILRDRQGQRLGDRLANTQVIEGLGARELVESLQRAMLDIHPERHGKEQPADVRMATGYQLPAKIDACVETSRRSPISSRLRRAMKSAHRLCNSSASSAA